MGEEFARERKGVEVVDLGGVGSARAGVERVGVVGVRGTEANVLLVGEMLLLGEGGGREEPLTEDDGADDGKKTLFGAVRLSNVDCGVVANVDEESADGERRLGDDWMKAEFSPKCPLEGSSGIKGIETGVLNAEVGRKGRSIYVLMGSPADFDKDIQLAKSYGIDAFALNIGVDPYTDAQLTNAFQSAVNNNFKVFISFDFNWYHTNQPVDVGNKIKQYASYASQLKINNKVVASSFWGDGIDIQTIRNTAGMDLYIGFNFQNPSVSNFAPLDGALNWLGWDNNGHNKAPAPDGHDLVSVEQGDQTYINALNGKDYWAPASAWFSTHFGNEVPYSKNWVFPGDNLWYRRWERILAMKPQFVDVTWNDYGESHYVAPLSSPHTDDGASKWVNDMPHTGWLAMSKPYIQAYKAGASSVASYIQDEKVVYWYRPNPRDLNCDATDTTMGSANNDSGNYFNGRPNGWQSLQDQVFVVSLLKSPGTVLVQSGSTAYRRVVLPPSSFLLALHAVIQPQRASGQHIGFLLRSENRRYSDSGIYNFNAYVGTVPAEQIDSLVAPAYGMFNQGLRVACDARPSLSTTPATVAPTTTITLTGTGGGTGPTQPPDTSTTTTTTTTSTTTTTTPPPGNGGTSKITFNVNAQTFWGENIFLTGNIDQLSNWNPYAAIGPLTNPNYPIWTVTVEVPANTAIQYKYIRKVEPYSNGQPVTWETDPNRVVTSPAQGQTITVNDTWK
ncbi:carbohydrate-binding module family 20 protein [Atractiella rhizophila]|nr:carbohydrate-binding module family 20 protein [Atractiella rhizophila]